MPVFYRDVMYREGGEGKDDAYLKLYDGYDWKWFCVRLSHTDMEYLRKNWHGRKASAPTLESKAPEVLPAFFVHRRSSPHKNVCKRPDYLQCGFGD